MTAPSLVEAIRATWHWTTPIPTTVTASQKIGSTCAGYGSRTDCDRWGVTLMTDRTAVRASLHDHHADPSELVESATWTHREFVEAMNDGQQEMFT